MELIPKNAQVLIFTVSWIWLSEQGINFTWSRQEDQDVAGSEESEEYHPTNMRSCCLSTTCI